jgi:hypothetical protein
MLLATGWTGQTVRNFALASVYGPGIVGIGPDGLVPANPVSEVVGVRTPSYASVNLTCRLGRFRTVMQLRIHKSKAISNGCASLNRAAQPKLTALFNDAADHLRSRIVAMCGILFVFNIGAWLWASIAFRHYPVLLGTALLAYGVGLRHAVDADHIERAYNGIDQRV